MVGLGNIGVFSIKSFYEKLPVREFDFLNNVVWIPKVSTVCFFTWLATRGDFASGKYQKAEGCLSLSVLHV